MSDPPVEKAGSGDENATEADPEALEAQTSRSRLLPKA